MLRDVCQLYTHIAQQVPAREAVAGLRPKILLNMGITLEAEGRLPDACDRYRCARRHRSRV